MSFLWGKKKKTESKAPAEQPKAIEREVIKTCEHCKGKGYHKIKHTETDGYALRYGAPEHYTTKEDCTECNGTGKIIRVIPRK